MLNIQNAKLEVRIDQQTILLRRRRVLDLLSNIYDMIRAVSSSTNVIK